MKTALALLSVVSALAVTAAVFPLPNPTRPAGFPLNRPALTGKVVAWGANDVGQTNIQAGLRDVVALAAGEEHTVALTADGKVVAWGANNLGQCNVPLDLNGVVAIAASGSFSLALRNDGRVFAWGHGGNGQLLVPVELNDAVAIAAAPSHAIALRLNGAVVAWGDGAAFEQAPPYPAVAIAGSTRRTLAIRDDSSISGRVDE